MAFAGAAEIVDRQSLERFEVPRFAREVTAQAELIADRVREALNGLAAIDDVAPQQPASPFEFGFVDR